MSDSRQRRIPANWVVTTIFANRSLQTRWAARSLRNIIGVLVLLITQSVLAFDLEAPFADPLFTLPDVMGTGASLPGSGEPIPCPVLKDFTEPLLLEEAVDLALCNNPQIKSSWAAIKVQAGLVGEARAAYLPTLSATTSRLQNHTAYPGSHVTATTMYGQTVYGTFSWHLFDFGGRAANRESANSLLVAAIATHDATLQKTLVAVIQAYFDAQTAKATLQAKEQDEVIAKNTLETAQRKEARGVASRGDTLQATTAQAKAFLDKNRAMGAYQKALSVLVYSLGVFPQTRLILAEDIRDKEELEAKSLDAWLDIAQMTHPAIISARAKLESAKQKITSARSDGMPTVDMSANYYQNGYPSQGLAQSQSRVTTVGISLAMPLFDGFSRTYKIREVEAQAEQSEAELQDTEHQVLMEVVKAYADASSSLDNLAASQKLLDSAQDALSTVQRKFDRGASDILEILNTQSAMSNAQLERIQCLADWRSARLRLLANAGMLGRKEIVTP